MRSLHLPAGLFILHYFLYFIFCSGGVPSPSSSSIGKLDDHVTKAFRLFFTGNDNHTFNSSRTALGPSSRPTRASANPTSYDGLSNGTALLSNTSLIGGDADLSDVCVLWDNTCHGNKSQALDRFYNDFESDFINCGSHFYTCKYDAPLVEKVQMWMRSPKCINDTAASDLPICCGNCTLEGGAVQIYYWPQPGSQDSCLEIVNSNVTAAFWDGATATTDFLGIVNRYWGCRRRATPSDPETIITLSFWAASNDEVPFKYPLVNPWSPVDCEEVLTEFPSAPQRKDFSVRVTSKLDNLSSSAIITSSPTLNSDPAIKIVVSDNLTL